MDNTIAQLASKLTLMGFPNEVKGNTIEARVPLPYSREFVTPSFKLHYSPEQKLIYYQPNRYSSERLLRNLEPKLKKLADETGLTLATRKGISPSHS